MRHLDTEATIYLSAQHTAGASEMHIRAESQISDPSSHQEEHFLGVTKPPIFVSSLHLALLTIGIE